MFGKLFASAFEGSMRGKSDALLVWFNMIAHSPSGVCDRTQQTIADETGLTLPRVTAAIEYLESPDPKSRSPDEEGRRIVRLDAHRDWGWRLVNHWKYHELRSAAEIKHQLQNRERQRRFKEKQKTKHVGNGVTLPNVTPVSVSVSDSVQKGKVQEGGKQNLITAARVIIHFLNEQASRCYRETDVNFKLICARLEEVNVDVEGVKKMIVRQVQLWKGGDMEQYLRPETLFNKTKFGSYFDNRDFPVAPKVTNSNPTNYFNEKPRPDPNGLPPKQR